MVPTFGVPMVDLGPLLPEHLSEILVGIVLMLLVYWVLRSSVVPAFEDMYHKRLDQIQGGMERAAKAEAEAEAARQKYQAQLASVREDAARIREDAKNQGAQILADLRAQATMESERILESGRTQLDVERSQAIQQLRMQVGGLATTLAGRIVGESLENDERAKSTVDRFLADLEAEAGAHETV